MRVSEQALHLIKREVVLQEGVDSLALVRVEGGKIPLREGGVGVDALRELELLDPA